MGDPSGDFIYWFIGIQNIYHFINDSVSEKVPE